MNSRWMPGAQGGQKKESDLLELELQVVVSHHVGGIEPEFSRRVSSAMLPKCLYDTLIVSDSTKNLQKLGEGEIGEAICGRNKTLESKTESKRVGF